MACVSPKNRSDDIIINPKKIGVDESIYNRIIEHEKQ
jgi:hypothetical protein